MAQIFKGRVYSRSPYPSAEVNYEYTRDGANMKYHFWGRVYLENSNGWYYNNLRLKLYLNGSDIYTKDCKSSSKGWSIDFDSGWHTVSNKTSGTTPFYFTVKDTQNTGWCNYTSGTYQLDVAPAYFSSDPTISLVSRTETTATFKWTTPETCSTVQYKIDNGSWVDVVADADAKSGQYTISGLSPGTSYTIYGDYKRKDSGLWAVNKTSVGVTTYSYPYLTSVPEFTVGNSLTIGIYNPLGRSCTISVIGDDGTEHVGGKITGTTISPFNDSGWLDNWYSTLKSKTQGIYKARLVCSTGNVNQTSGSVKYYLNTSDTGFKPSFTSGNIINVVNTVNTDISGADKFIKGHNSLSGTITPMTAKRYASGSYYNVSASGLNTVKKNYSSSNINFDLGNMTSDSFNVTAVDSRGFSTTASKSINLVDYNKPGITTSKIIRQNGIGTKAIISFTGVYTNWSGLLKTNSIEYIKYKIGASGAWKNLPSNATITSSNGVWTLNAILDDTFATTSQYELYLQIKDLLETVELGSYTISTADAFIWKDLANKRVGINKKPEYSFDVLGDSHFSNKLYADGDVHFSKDLYTSGCVHLGSGQDYPLEFPNAGSAKCTKDGDFVHKRNNTGDWIGFRSYDKSKNIKIFWEYGLLESVKYRLNGKNNMVEYIEKVESKSEGNWNMKLIYFTDGTVIFNMLVNYTLDVTKSEGSSYYIEFDFSFPSGLFKSSPRCAFGVEAGGGFNAHYVTSSINASGCKGWMYTNTSRTGLSGYIDIVGISTWK